MGTIALSYPPPPVIDDSSLKNAAESFTVALTLTLGGTKKCNSTTGCMYVVNAFVFVFMVRCLLLKIKVRLLTDLIANVFRLLMSSDVSSVEPRYLHFFQSPLFLFILYSSVFDSFIAMSHFVSNFGVSSLNLCNQ